MKDGLGINSNRLVSKRGLNSCVSIEICIYKYT